jgi:hypothetical protein
MANHFGSNTSSISVKQQNMRPLDAKQQRVSGSYSAGFSGIAIRRIREPHKNDVLSGRGGGINSHDGNVQFRKWVAERKNDYNLAANKAAKAEVAREVIAMVQSQDPPGRFLQKDPSSIGNSSWWIELDDEKIMAKTSQALREGAPQIRAAHKDELLENRARSNTGRIKETVPISPKKRKIGYVEPDEVITRMADKPRVLSILQQNMKAAQETRGDEPAEFEHPEKRFRMAFNGQTLSPYDATPPLTAAPAPDIIPLESATMPPPAVMRGNSSFARTNSLALSDISAGDFDVNEDFVNPFENESDLESVHGFAIPPRLGVYRESSVSSDMGGYEALFGPAPPKPPRRTFAQSGVRVKSIGPQSNKYEIQNDFLPPLGETESLHDWNRGHHISHKMKSPSRSLSGLSDLPEISHLNSDFSEGVKQIYDALHQEDDEAYFASPRRSSSSFLSYAPSDRQ